MARLARMEYSGAIYHVTVRGNNRRDVFADDQDRRRFLERLKESAEDSDVRVYAFCLMRNHVHLVVETPRGNLGRFMHKLETAYTVYFNKRHREGGHLFQGRYGAKIVEGDDYLLALTRYVHLNPVFVKGMKTAPMKERIRALRAYAWSSYRTYLGRSVWGFVQVAPLLALMGVRKRSQQRVAFRKYVEAGLAETDEEFIAVYRGSRLGIGGEKFLAELHARYDETVRKRSKIEDVALRRVGRCLDTDVILGLVCQHLGAERGEECMRQRGGWLRAIGARMLTRFGGLTQREVAAWFGVRTGKSVSDQLKKLNEMMAKDRNLDRRVKALEAVLSTMSVIKH